jgi:hypothetical protein
VNIIETGLKKDLRAFVNPSVVMSQEASCGVIAAFYDYFDCPMPEPPEGVMMAEVTLTASGVGQIASRAMAAPNMSTAERQDFVNRIREIVPDEFRPDRGLSVPWEGSLYGRLQTATDGVVTTENSKGVKTAYALGRQTPEGKVVSQQAYYESLIKAGQAVRSSDNDKVWVFDSAMDVQLHSRRPTPNMVYVEYRKFGELFFEIVKPTSTPESHIVIQAIHRLIGSPLPKMRSPGEEQYVDYNDVVNEAVCRVENGQLIPDQIVVVGWNANSAGWSTGRDSIKVSTVHRDGYTNRKTGVR